MNLFHEAKKVLDKDGKVNPLGPYGKMKLTGQEVTNYFRKNKVSDAKVKRAVEVALDMSGAMDIASKEIKKFFGDKILKSKEVQSALKYANEETISESAEMVIHTDDAVQSNLVVKMASKHGLKSKKTKISWSGKDGVVVSGDSNKLKKFMSAVEKMSEETVSEAMKIKDIFRKHKRELTKAYKTGDLSFSGSAGKKAEDDLTTWALNNNEIKSDDPDEFFDWLSRDLEDIVKGKIKEERINENYRVLAKHGMGAETKNSIKVGTEVDYYRADGAKYMGKVTKMTPKGYIVKDDKNGKNYQFTYHDRVKAKKYLKQGDNIQEKVEYAEYKFRNKRDAQKALDYFKSQQLIKLELNDDGLSQGELAVDAGKYDMSKYHKEVLKKFKPKVLTTEMASAQQAAIAIAKKKKNESVMDSYRTMWEDAVTLDEQVADLTVDIRNKISKPADQNKHAMEIAKQAKRFGLKSSMMGKHVRLKGGKKAVNDFLRVVIGKSSYGDPTEQDTSTPQIDKILTKGLK